MSGRPSVAQRAASQLRRAIPVIAALAIALAATATVARPAQAAYAPRVVIVVGPTHGATADFLSHARDYARQARAYGAFVTTVFHPHATWQRVMAAAQGANVFIYLGHGNGWPSPYAPWQGDTKDGLGLNPYDGASKSQVKYYGEDWIRAHLRFAPGAVVLFNRLCYASGDGEPGMANPSWSTAVKRVDNYASGFIDAGASTVIADGHTTWATRSPACSAPAARSSTPGRLTPTRTATSARSPRGARRGSPCAWIRTGRAAASTGRWSPGTPPAPTAIRTSALWGTAACRPRPAPRAGDRRPADHPARRRRPLCRPRPADPRRRAAGRGRR